ncbi:hypothetical protein ACFFQF_25070 [Haladaptatus pallidirubidus]|nr:hypothetical protein [Haladaptatus pallidirubidus]
MLCRSWNPRFRYDEQLQKELGRTLILAVQTVFYPREAVMTADGSTDYPN